MLGTPLDGRLRRSCRRSHRGAAHGSNFCQPKVQNFCVFALGDEDVRGFNVAVNDAFAVGGV